MVITGVDGGHDIDLRRFAAEGVVICGRLRGVEQGKLGLGEGAEQLLAGSDQAYGDFKRAVDDYIGAENICAPEDVNSDPFPDAAPLEGISTLDLRGQNIASIIWSTGYRFAFDWLKIPVLSKDGVPIQERGVTRRAGLYFLGLHWMHTFKSGVIFGVGDDASHIADHITVQHGRAEPLSHSLLSDSRERAGASPGP